MGVHLYTMCINEKWMHLEYDVVGARTFFWWIGSTFNSISVKCRPSSFHGMIFPHVLKKTHMHKFKKPFNPLEKHPTTDFNLNVTIFTNLLATPNYPPQPKLLNVFISACKAQFFATSSCFASKVMNHFILSQCSYAQLVGIDAFASMKSFKPCCLLFKKTFACTLNSRNNKSQPTYSQFSSKLDLISFII